MKEKVAKHKFLVTYFGDTTDKEYTDAFLKASEAPIVDHKYHYLHTNDKDCAVSYGVKSMPGVVLFRRFDEHELVYTGKWEPEALVSWFLASQTPTLIEFNEEHMEPIFSQKQPAIFLFHGPNDDKGSDFMKVFAEAAHSLKGEILFVVSGVSEGIQARLAEYVDVDTTHTPTIRLLDPNNNMAKYSYGFSVHHLHIEGLKHFIRDFKNGHLKPHMKTQNEPDEEHNAKRASKVIVGKTFHDKVIESEDDVFIKFFAPWCGHCKKMTHAWDLLAEELRDVNGLLIAEMDATANEVENVEI